ncbi:MAG: tRNA uridine-5-carboxymethylaminomethyl(34) synthesis GTPase MnmE, partial [Desulfosarcina sp.]
AISTPLGPGGIGIIRISGPESHPILKRLFVHKNQGSPTARAKAPQLPFSSHRLYYGHIVEPLRGHVLDEVLVVFMQAPKSFTREDVVEIHSHSGFVVLDRILQTVVDAGAELASPGAFTKRAFLNGRIDLAQAEAVIDLINAPCETAVHLANQQIRGGMKDALKGIRRGIDEMKAVCEASIEFEAVEEGDMLPSKLSQRLKAETIPSVSKLIQMQKGAAIYRDGVTLSIAGAPNVGKSSLLNKLVQNETAIVSEVPGTTRDIVRDHFSINGIPVIVCDTAGIHDTNDPVECMGIQKAREHFDRSDIILMVLEGTRTLNDFEVKLLQDFTNVKTIAVINKDDIADASAVASIQRGVRKRPTIRVSAKTGAGIESLKKMIFEDLVHTPAISLSETATPNLRQRRILEAVHHELTRAVAAAESGQPLDILSEQLNRASTTLKEISGKRNQEDLYDHIFNQFCIGK